MRNIKSSYIAIIVVMLLSCNEKSPKEMQNEERKKIDVMNYEGNAFVFIERDAVLRLIFIIPISEKDSDVFKKMDVSDIIGDNISIQYRSDYYYKFFKDDRNKKINPQRKCNLTEDSMYYSKVCLKYGNYEDNYRLALKQVGKDSCKTASLS